MNPYQPLPTTNVFSPYHCAMTTLVHVLTDFEASVLAGLDHCSTAPVRIDKSFLVDDHAVTFSRSMTEKKEVLRHDIKLDRLSEREKVET